MNTNFFSSIAALQVQGNFKMAIHAGEQNQMTVSLLFNATANGDQAAKTVPPMLLKGTAAELDAGFFEAIAKPVQDTAALFQNMEAYLKSLEEAKKKSKMEQDKREADKKAKAAVKPAAGGEDIEVSEPKADPSLKRKAYEEAMKQIVELNDACKYAEALELLPAVADYPDKQAELERKRADLSRKKAQHEQMLELFNQPAA